MDRSDADAVACARSVEEKLQVTPLMLHKPLVYEDRLIGECVRYFKSNFCVYVLMKIIFR